MHNVALKESQYSPIINNDKRTTVAKKQSRVTAPIALLYPPTIKEGVIDVINDVVASGVKHTRFENNSEAYSGLILFARYAGLLNDIDWLNDTADGVEYDKLFDLYGTSLTRIGDWLNREQFKISGVRNSQTFMCLDAVASKIKEPVLWMTSALTPCVIPMGDDDDIDSLVHSVLVLLGPSACTLLPEDYFSFNEWFVEEGEALNNLKTHFKSDDLSLIAEGVFNKPELFSDMLSEVELGQLDSESAFLENLEYINTNYEEIPSHLSYEHSLSYGQIQHRLSVWKKNNDERINDPRIAGIRQALKVIRAIKKRAKQGIENPASSIRVDSNDVSVDDFDNYFSAEAALIVQYGLKFEERLSEIFHNEMMEMGEEPTSFFSLSPNNNKQLYDTLLNMAQTQGVIAMLSYPSVQ